MDNEAKELEQLEKEIESLDEIQVLEKEIEKLTEQLKISRNNTDKSVLADIIGEKRRAIAALKYPVGEVKAKVVREAPSVADHKETSIRRGNITSAGNLFSTII